MVAVHERGPSRAVAAGVEWFPVIAGLLALYGPTIYGLATRQWRMEDQSHGPIILGIVVWLIWRERCVLGRAAAGSADREASAKGTGFLLLILGLLLYTLGRSQGISLFEVGSTIPVLAGAVLAMRGWRAWHAAWFPILFLAFMIPLPGFFVDMVSGPIKQHVSAISEQLLYVAGYPVARTGVVIAIGRYQLLVSEACAGLNSMFSLLAVGALYLHLARRPSMLHNCLVLASLLPVAFCANVVRVIVLVVVTYRFGDAVGQGYLHGVSGLLLFVTALLLIVLLDAFLARAIRPSSRA